jgi:hypothetical protein
MLGQLFKLARTHVSKITCLEKFFGASVGHQLDRSILRTQREVALTAIAPEIVNVSCAATDRTETCGRFVFNSATGALEIARAYRDKAAKAVMRDLRQTKLRVYFVFARLYRL